MASVHWKARSVITGGSAKPSPRSRLLQRRRFPPAEREAKHARENPVRGGGGVALQPVPSPGHPRKARPDSAQAAPKLRRRGKSSRRRCRLRAVPVARAAAAAAKAGCPSPSYLHDLCSASAAPAGRRRLRQRRSAGFLLSKRSIVRSFHCDVSAAARLCLSIYGQLRHGAFPSLT